MKFGEKFKKALGLDADYIDDEVYDEEEEEEEDPRVPETTRRTAYDRPVLRPQREAPPASSRRTPTKVVDIHTTAKLQVVLKKPEHFDEATGIADELLERRTVVLNLEATAKDEAGKLICFLSGVAYSNGGKLKKIANNTYIITPYNVDVMGDLLDELENNGMFFV
ncbi:MAG: cell division protein SepF [Clostridia bacterium]|nr:cell division protein SepF [Clostridia bacterium]